MSITRLVPQAARRTIRVAYIETARLASPWRPLPDYLVIGAARAGSTSLYEYLVQHPAVMPALVKEVHYFTAGYDLGSDWYRAHFPMASRRRLTAMRHGRAATGEATPYYLFHPKVPGRIAELMPHVRLIAVLRDPVLRALSHYQHERRLGVEPLSFEEAIDAEARRLDPGSMSEVDRLGSDPEYAFRHQHFAYLARGRYAEQLARYLAAFPPEQIMVVRSEDLFGRPDDTYRGVLRFLSLPERSLPKYARFNASRGMTLDAALETRLRNYFAPHNARLDALLGRPMQW